MLAARRLVSGFVEFFFEDEVVSGWASEEQVWQPHLASSSDLQLSRPLAVVVDDVQRQLQVVQWERSGSEDWHDGHGVERAFWKCRQRPCQLIPRAVHNTTLEHRTP